MQRHVKLALAAVIALVLLIYLILDRYPRYASWRALSSAKIADATQWYIDNRASDVREIAAICVYALDCSDTRARLSIVPTPDQFDLDALRKRIWARRFSGVCQGRSANLGLHVLRANYTDLHWYSDLAIWSFYNDRFIPIHGRFSGGAFSEEPWERCSIERATYLVQEGQLLSGSN